MRRLLRRVEVTSFFSIIGSLLIVAIGQPARSEYVSILSACLGFSLFFWGCKALDQRFWLGTAWFSAVQLIQLSWMTSIEYQGYYILFVYLTLALFLGLQFGFLSLLIPKQGALSFLKVLQIASSWTLMEWLRLFVVCGFSWNPIGLALSSHILALQFSALFGIFGLSFWVMLTNLFGLNALQEGSLRRICYWGCCASIPYLFGYLHLHYHSSRAEESREHLHVALVQTALLPSEKVPTQGRLQEFISPLEQWRRIVHFLQEKGERNWHLIVLPEAALPLQANFPFFLFRDVQEMFKECFGEEVLSTLPPLSSVYGKQKMYQGKLEWVVSHLYWCQALANIYQAELLIGLDHRDEKSQKNYNAAFHFLPKSEQYERYDKRILLPLAEYLPFEWLRPLTKSYGIQDFFSQGKKAAVVGQRIRLSPSICYEETFPGIIREGKRQGASVLVNLTNDNYYPNSLLPEQHFCHARVRSVENGLPLLRACNSGVTAAIDSLGRVVARLGENREESEWAQGALVCQIKIYPYTTLYSLWGDAGIVGLCLCILLIQQRSPFLVKFNLKKKCIIG